MMKKNFPEYDHWLRERMGRFGINSPDLMSGYVALQKAALKPGAISVKQKELIALAIGVVLRCDGCIGYHVSDALEAGATKEEIIEAVGVAVMMGGGPALVYGLEAVEAIKQFQSSIVLK